MNRKQKSQIVFAQARAFLIEQKDLALSPLEAYEQSLTLVAQVKPKFVEQIKSHVDESDHTHVDLNETDKRIEQVVKQY